MVSVRFRALANTLLVVVGALLIGQALHLSVVSGQTGVLAPGTLARVGVGTALVVLGRVVHNPVEEAASRYRRRENELGGGTDEEFDPDLSPVGDSSESEEP